MQGSYCTSNLSNVWIVKAASNARGQGIYVSDKLSEILPKNESGNQGKDRIVMKYVEDPLLYPVYDTTSRKFRGHKFDIRWWVLLRSVKPLKAYLFSSFYGRLCSKPYSMEDFGDSSVHLSNYSVNKANFRSSKGRSSSVLSSQVLKDYISKVKGVDWDLLVLPKVEKIVRSTLEACCPKMKHRNRGFDIYGFDFLLDNQLNPWLLEANLSPACSERTAFLTKMLDGMTAHLFHILGEDERKEEV